MGRGKREDVTKNVTQDNKGTYHFSYISFSYHNHLYKPALNNFGGKPKRVGMVCKLKENGDTNQRQYNLKEFECLSSQWLIDCSRFSSLFVSHSPRGRGGCNTDTSTTQSIVMPKEIVLNMVFKLLEALD